MCTNLCVTTKKEIWSTQGMQTFKDYLIYYNNLDTGPFVTALSSFIYIILIEKKYCGWT